MKKAFSLFLLLAGLWGLTAQNNIPNSDFELWSYGKPVGWTIGLHGDITSIVNLPLEVNFGTQSSDAHGGNSAVRLASADLTIPYTTYSFNLPGILQAGESEGFSIPLEDVMAIVNMLQDSTGFGGFDSTDLSALSSLSQLLSNGVPCNQTPASITVWVKYLPQAGDQLMMIAMTKKDGEVVGYTYDSFLPEDTVSYHKVGLFFDEANAECDSILLIILSSTQLNSSSVLYVDDISLDFSGESITDFGNFTGKIYPNPASDRLYIRPDNENTYEWSLIDPTGKRLQTGKASGEIFIDTKAYASGTYLLQIREKGKSSSYKVLIR